MRIASIILIALGIWGLFYPQTLLELDEGQGRLVFLLIIALGAYSLWRSLKTGKF